MHQPDPWALLPECTDPIPVVSPLPQFLRSFSFLIHQLPAGHASSSVWEWIDTNLLQHDLLTQLQLRLYLGARAIIDGRFKLVLHEAPKGSVTRELFDLQADPAEKVNLVAERAEIAERLQTRLRDWQRSVLHSLTGADDSE